MNKFETKQNAEPRKYYVRKPSSDRDIMFLEAVNQLMAIWDTCKSNRLDKLVEILESMRNNGCKNRFDCDDLIEMFKSSKNGFIGKENWFTNKPVDYNDKLPFLVWLLDGKQRYKMIKELLPMTHNSDFMLEMLVINEFATLEDIRDAFKSGIQIDKRCISAFRSILCKEYNRADSAKRVKIKDLVQDIVFCIEHSSYMDNTQCVQNMYKQFGISGTQVKKSDFMTAGEGIIKQDTKKIIEYLNAHSR